MSINWPNWIASTLRGYDESLLRQVSGRLFKPRNQWPVDELIDRALATLQNPPVVDRRLKDIDPAARQMLGVIGASRQPHWAIGSLVELSASLGNADPLSPLKTLLEEGLAFPDFVPANGDGKVAARQRLKDFDTWLAGAETPSLFILPLVGQRALQSQINLPACPGAFTPESLKPTLLEADGLDLPMRLAAIWQEVSKGPLRRTQQGDFFKRDLDRLRQHPLLGGPSSEAFAELPDPALMNVALALAWGILVEDAGELKAGEFPESWTTGLQTLIADAWAHLPRMRSWNPGQGWAPSLEGPNPYPSAYLLALLLLSKLPEGQWADPELLEAWVLEKHPFWMHNPKAGKGVISKFLLGLAYPFRWIQATKTPSGFGVRLSTWGAWLVGAKETPANPPSFPQTLLVQPNLEILAYRQGLTPDLIVRLTRAATWKALGAACTLQLEPDSVYRALQSGETFATLTQLLDRHGMKPTPAPVLESLRTWSDKRDRITVYTSGALFEFATAADLAEALARGLPATKLTDRLAVVPSESSIDYRHFRLTGTRDYFLPPEQCVAVEPDGVTLVVDQSRSDLLLESELTRFAEPLARAPVPGRKPYRLTPATLGAARKQGLNTATLDQWFLQRTGEVAPPAAKLILNAPDTPQLTTRRQLILHVATPEIADGLLQFPETRSLIESRLGPTALVIAETNMTALETQCRTLGLSWAPLT